MSVKEEPEEEVERESRKRKSEVASKDVDRKRHKRSRSGSTERTRSRSRDRKRRDRGRDNRRKHQRRSRTRSRSKDKESRKERSERAKETATPAPTSEAEQRRLDVLMGKTKPSLTGGVYIPPHKLRELQNNLNDKSSLEYQRLTWDALKKSLNGLINKVNVSNIGNIVQEIFAENIIRGRGLMSRSLMKAQAASPGFTKVYAALVAVINTKMPSIGELVLCRLVSQFLRAYRRNDKTILISSTRYHISHLFLLGSL